MDLKQGFLAPWLELPGRIDQAIEQMDRIEKYVADVRARLLLLESKLDEEQEGDYSDSVYQQTESEAAWLDAARRRAERNDPLKGKRSDPSQTPKVLRRRR